MHSLSSKDSSPSFSICIGILLIGQWLLLYALWNFSSGVGHDITSPNINSAVSTTNAEDITTHVPKEADLKLAKENKNKRIFKMGGFSVRHEDYLSASQTSFNPAVEFRELGTDEVTSIRSSQHCVGYDLDLSDNGWTQTSCYYNNICFDPNIPNGDGFPGSNPPSGQFLYLMDPDEKKDVQIKKNQASQLRRHNVASGTPSHFNVSLGSLNPNWSKYDKEQLRWQPTATSSKILEGRKVLMATNDSLWMPYHSMCGNNIGHLLWDEFLTWFMLRRLFSLEYLQFRPLLVTLKSSKMDKHKKTGTFASLMYFPCPQQYFSKENLT